MTNYKKSALIIFLFGFVLGFALFLWITNGPCYDSASIFSFFGEKFEPCNAESLSRQLKKTASLSLVAPVTVVKVGQSFSVDLVVNPGGIDINAVGTRISNTTSTTVISNDESMSPFSLHLTDPLAPADIKRVVQVAPNPGVLLPSKIAIFTFTAVAPGPTTIMLGTSSLVLANDGFGTDVLGALNNVTITIVP